MRDLNLSRRAVFGLGVGAVAAITLAACAPTRGWVGPTGQAVADAEATRGGTGKVTKAILTAVPTQLDLAGKPAATWAFGGIPAPVIRLGAGDTLQAIVRNQLPTDTSVHWHGLAIRNDMDGVPPLTQSAIPSGGSFNYEFVAPNPGTYWFHPHVGVQLDRGLYGTLIVDDPHEPLSYDDEWVIILDDWLDGVDTTPDDQLKTLQAGMGSMSGMNGMDGMDSMGGMSSSMTSTLLGGDAGDVSYPDYLINGKPIGDPAVFTGKPGQRVRIRLINAGSDTAFRVAIGGHVLTVTHSDGYPVQHLDADSVLLGMGERYDVVVTLGDGAFPLVAAAEGKQAQAFAIIRTGSGPAPTPGATIAELSSTRIATGDRLSGDASAQLATRQTDRTISIALTGSMMQYDWGINGHRFDPSQPLKDALAVQQGERVRLNIANQTTMWHPFHLHGHTFQTQAGARKDTSIVLPGQSINVDFDADNPGLWAAHCHNAYHAESGMMTVLGYQD